MRITSFVRSRLSHICEGALTSSLMGVWIHSILDESATHWPGRVRQRRSLRPMRQRRGQAVITSRSVEIADGGALRSPLSLRDHVPARLAAVSDLARFPTLRCMRSCRIVGGSICDITAPRVTVRRDTLIGVPGQSGAFNASPRGLVAWVDRASPHGARVVID